MAAGDIKRLTKTGFSLLHRGSIEDDSLLGSDLRTVVQPGQAVQIVKTASKFGTTPGFYEIKAQYISLQNKAIDLPQANVNTYNQSNVNVVPPGTELKPIQVAQRTSA